MVDKGNAIKIVAGEEIVEETDANLEKRKIGEPDINPGGASSSTADTPKRRESEQGSSANESSLDRGSQQPFVGRANCRPQPRSRCTDWKIPRR